MILLCLVSHCRATSWSTLSDSSIFAEESRVIFSSVGSRNEETKRSHVVVVVVSHMPWGQMPNRHVVKCVSSVALLFSSFSRTAQTRDKYHTHLHVLFVAVFDIFPFSSFSSLELDSSLSHCLSVDRLSDFSVSAFLSWV